MKTAVSIPDDLFDKAEAAAKRLKVSRSKLYQAALQSYLKTARSAAVTAALNRSYSENPEPTDLLLQALAGQTMSRMEADDETRRNLVGRSLRPRRSGAGVQKTRRRRLGK